MANREIKFRVWDRVDFMSKPFTLHELQVGLVQFTCDCLIMQYTGLKDSNGKEIFEGDIIANPKADNTKMNASWHIVEWHDSGLWGKQVGTYGSRIGLTFYTQHGGGYVVIGNIYENPELLEVVTEKA